MSWLTYGARRVGPRRERGCSSEVTLSKHCSVASVAFRIYRRSKRHPVMVGAVFVLLAGGIISKFICGSPGNQRLSARFMVTDFYRFETRSCCRPSFCFVFSTTSFGLQHSLYGDHDFLASAGRRDAFYISIMEAAVEAMPFYGDQDFSWKR